jgi:hypothetical protein
MEKIFIKLTFSLRTVLSILSLSLGLVSCSILDSNTDTENTTSNQYRGSDDQRPLVDDKYILKSDRQKLEDLRKEIPQNKKNENDEEALFAQYFSEVKKEPSFIREQFSKLVSKKREVFDKDLRKERDLFSKKEQKDREEFLKNQDRLKKEFSKDKKTREESNEFYKNLNDKRNEYFSSSREKRDDFEADVRDRRKNFEDHVREKQNSFNQQIKEYTLKYNELKKQQDQ